MYWITKDPTWHESSSTSPLACDERRSLLGIVLVTRSTPSPWSPSLGSKSLVFGRGHGRLGEKHKTNVSLGAHSPPPNKDWKQHNFSVEQIRAQIILSYNCCHMICGAKQYIIHYSITPGANKDSLLDQVLISLLWALFLTSTQLWLMRTAESQHQWLHLLPH